MDVCNREAHHFHNASSDRVDLIKKNQIHPLLLLSNKRKSSPAILDLPFHETLPRQQRNSIEAAMLLVNFNQSITVPDNKGQETQDDMSILTNHKESLVNRRYSYDSEMSWDNMPEGFLDRTDLITSSNSSTTTSEDVYNPKIIWTHDSAPPYIDNQPTLLYPPPRFPAPPQDPMLHPLAQPSFHGGMKRDYPAPYYFPPQQQQHMYYHPMIQFSPIPVPPTTNKKHKPNDDSEEEVSVSENEYPRMTAKDLELAKTQPEARPRKQKLRFVGDQYTPSWVRYNGQAKEGLCDTCNPGKWLQLKNSAFWYHKQFYHGISSVSGKQFVQPLEKRWAAQDLIEGLCHQCNLWIAVSNIKRKNSVLWYRHAHKCHLYNKPKHTVSRKR